MPAEELGNPPEACEGRALKPAKRETLLYNVVIFLVALTVVATALLYWGGFREEARNR